MRKVGRLATTAAVALLVVAGGGCADSSGEESSPSPSSSSPATPSNSAPATPSNSAPATPSNSAPATPSSSAPPGKSEVAAQAAADLVRDYYVVRDLLRQDPESRLARLKTVATSSELAAQRTLFTRERERGVRQTGDTVIARLEVQSVNLDNSDPAAGKVPQVDVDVCFDVSGVDIVNADGKSIVSPNRQDTGWIRYTVANYHWSKNPDDGWRVATSQDLEQAPCPAS